MSTWTDYRDRFEGLFQPLIHEAITFAHVIEADAKKEATGDLKKAFVDGYTVYAATPGDFTAKIIAGVSALLLELVGDAVTLVKKEIDAPATPAPAEAV